MTETIIIAEAPGERDAPPDGPTWAALAELAGVRDVRQLGRPATLLGFPCRPRPAKLRAFAAAVPLEGQIVLLGRRMAAAFGASKRKPLEWQEMGGAMVASFPHPSGANRWWNRDENRAAAVTFLRALAVAPIPETAPPPPAPPKAPEQPADVLARRHDEHGKAWLAFSAYLQLGAGRTFKAVCLELGRPEKYLRQLKKWGGRHDWQGRCREYDTRMLRRSMAGREDQAEMARQVLYDQALEAARFVGEVRRGEVDGTALTGVPVSTRLQAALQALDRIGVSAHKRTEIVHFDGDLMPAGGVAMAKLELDEVRAFALLGEAPPIGERR